MADRGKIEARNAVLVTHSGANCRKWQLNRSDYGGYVYTGATKSN